MGQLFVIHNKNPQPRLIKQVVMILQKGGIIIYPTDSSYAVGCRLENKAGLDKIRQLRQLDEKHLFTLVCRNLSELGTYALVDNPTFRQLKAHIPGPYTFILKGSKEVPKRLMHPKRNTIGLRIPDNQIVQALLAELGEPLMSVTLALPEQEYPLVDALHIYEKLGAQVDLVIDGGTCGSDPTTIVDFEDGVPNVLRVGKGDPSSFS